MRSWVKQDIITLYKVGSQLIDLNFEGSCVLFSSLGTRYVIPWVRSIGIFWGLLIFSLIFDVHCAVFKTGNFDRHPMENSNYVALERLCYSVLNSSFSICLSSLIHLALTLRGACVVMVFPKISQYVLCCDKIYLYFWGEIKLLVERLFAIKVHSNMAGLISSKSYVI